MTKVKPTTALQKKKVVKAPVKTAVVPVMTKNITDVIGISRTIGDKLATVFAETGDIRVALVSLDGYKTAISGAKAQLIYKKLTGTPGKIPFLEG